QVRAKGVRKIEGRVLIDASLVPDGPREGGTNVVMSSIMVNDNVIDVVARPGVKPGDPLAISTAPATRYARFVNRSTTTTAGSRPIFNDPEFLSSPDGSVQITLSGSLPLGGEPQTVSIAVPSPTEFAGWVLREALSSAGV